MLVCKNVSFVSRGAFLSNKWYTVLFLIENNSPIIKDRYPVPDTVKKIDFGGRFFSFYEPKYYFNLQIVPDNRVLWISQNGIIRGYVNKHDTFDLLAESEGDYSSVHYANRVSINERLFVPGEATIWLDFTFGNEAISTNKFTFIVE